MKRDVYNYRGYLISSEVVVNARFLSVLTDVIDRKIALRDKRAQDSRYDHLFVPGLFEWDTDDQQLQEMGL